MTANLQATIPRFLIGRERQVTRAWRSLANRLFALEPWDQVFAAEPFVPVDAVGYPIVLSGPLFEGLDDDEQILLYPVFEHLAEIGGRDGRRRLDEVRRLVFQGVGHFWFDVCVLGAGPRLYPVSGNPAQDRADALFIVRHVVQHWPELCALEPRYMSGAWFAQRWPLWGMRVASLCRQAGVNSDDLQQVARLDPSEAGAEINRLLAPLIAGVV